MTVTDLDKQRPHLVINADDGVHVISVKDLEDIASGKDDFNLEGREGMFRRILQEWLNIVS